MGLLFFGLLLFAALVAMLLRCGEDFRAGKSTGDPQRQLIGTADYESALEGFGVER